LQNSRYNIPSGEISMPNSPGEERDPKKNPWVQIARYTQLAFTLPAATVVGWLAGSALDHWLHTTWIYIAGILVGILAGFVELVRTVMRDSN
jgi:F0F1-type ATP synthase assembly protein I